MHLHIPVCQLYLCICSCVFVVVYLGSTYTSAFRQLCWIIFSSSFNSAFNHFEFPGVFLVLNVLLFAYWRSNKRKLNKLQCSVKTPQLCPEKTGKMKYISTDESNHLKVMNTLYCRVTVISRVAVLNRQKMS